MGVISGRSTLDLAWRQVCHRVEVAIACRPEAELTHLRSSRCTTKTAKTTPERNQKNACQSTPHPHHWFYVCLASAWHPWRFTPHSEKLAVKRREACGSSRWMDSQWRAGSSSPRSMTDLIHDSGPSAA